MTEPRQKPGRYDWRDPTLGAVMTHDEVAAAMGICRQRVVQLEAAALRKLKRFHVLREFLNASV